METITNEAKLNALLQESVALVAMAVHMFADPDDSLEMRDKWINKANEIVREYYGHVAKSGADSAETRYQDWIGD